MELGTIRFACNTSFLRHFDGSLDRALSAVREIGYDLVEIPVFSGRCSVASMGLCPSSSLDQDPALLRQKLHAHGLGVSQVDSGGSLMGADANTFGVAYLKQALRFAREIGAPFVIGYDGPRRMEGMDEADTFSQIRQNLLLVLQTARLYNVGVNIEPHGPITRSVRGMQRIMGLIDGELADFLGVNFDTGNTFIAGEDPLTYLKAVAPRVRHLHAKDVAPTLAQVQWGLSTGIPPSGVAVGDGVIAQQIADCIAFLRSIRWSGVISVETEGVENAKRSLAWLKGLLST